jgi:hypothetical protein
MPKKIFLILMLLASSSLYAQNITFGVKVGPNFTTLGGEGSSGDETKFRIGYHVGGYASFTISESLSFESGIQFASKGAKAIEEPYSSLSSSVVRNNYIDLPLLLKFRSGKTFYLLAGAQPSFMISSAVVLGDGKNKVAINGSDIRDLWKGFDFAGVIGLGVEVGAGMYIQTTYEHGFANVSEISESVYNRGFKLTVGKSF